MSSPLPGPSRVTGLNLCHRRNNHRKVPAAPPTALSPLSSPKLPFTLLNYLHHLSLHSVILHHLNLSTSALCTATGQAAVALLCRGMSHGSAEAWLQQTLPAEPSHPCLLPCFISAHGCRLQFLTVTNEAAESSR